MKPYWGILVDSFWEAVGNRVLWAQLLGWTFILGALAPFGYVTERSFELTSVDIASEDRLIEKLARGIQQRGPRPLRHVAQYLEQDFKERILRAERSRDDPDLWRRYRLRERELAQGLNRLLSVTEFYDESIFPTAHKRSRLEPLIAVPPDRRSSDQVQELNRELLQLVFPTELNRPRGEQLWLGYAGVKLGEPLPVTRRQIDQFIQPLVLQFIIKFGLAVIAVFIAVIVTSPMIPETFRSGSLHLLLSKPISRTWLFLTKFLGGTVFVLVTITYVMLGLFLIAGLRFDIWNTGLLYCIPVLVFVFLVFYSVSAMAGLVWGNAIVCVVACGVFWFACLVLGIVHDSMTPHVDLLPRIAKVEPLEGRLTTVNERGTFQVWNERFQVWQPAADVDMGSQALTFGPIYLTDERKVVFKSFARTPFGGLVSRSRRVAIIDLAAEVDEAPRARAEVTSREEARDTPWWTIDLGPELPPQMFTMLAMGDEVVAVCRGGIFRMNKELFAATEENPVALFGIKLPWLNRSTFENISPDGFFLTENTAAVTLCDGSGLLVYRSGDLDVLQRTASGLQVVASGTLDGDPADPAMLAMNERYAVVARPDLPLVVFDAQLQKVHEVPVGEETDVKQLSCIPGSDDFSLVTHDGQLWRLHSATGEIERYDWEVTGVGVTCIRWIDEREAYLGVRPDCVVRVDMTDGDVLQRYEPAPRWIDRVYRWVVVPMYAVMPKPAALDNVMTWLLTDETSIRLGSSDLQQARLELDIWEPLISNTVFVVVLLAACSWYLARKEF
ncbi:MAG: hypothetical protein KatS3mg111_1822 [Pirellulaceae bacterium]|nr:MAG: hypothetical protein KatS3mg111_1822 [Pirellulaceae bacterium]